jgi:CubicO group peptidase (beta-lactamase class C family)
VRVATVTLLVAVAVSAQTVQKQAQVDHIFSEFNNHTPGCSVGVAQNGTVVLETGYGMADLERHVPIGPATIFESGSVAKQFTGAALLLLAQQGKISLDDPLRKYLPELPDYGVPLTIRHVLSHTSGLREWRSIAEYRGLPEGRLVYNNQDLLEMAAMQHGLNFGPGTHYSYTNTGFNILTILVERALGNGKTFQEFTREMIFNPLGMTHTRWRDDYRAVVPNRALAYERSGGETWIQDTPVENIIGAGGLLTTVGDLLLWNENFTHARVGGPAFVKAQQTPAVLANGHTIRYAVGLEIDTVDGLREVSHAGATGGYRTWLGRYPEQGVSVAVLCNAASANPQGLGRDTARLWTGATPAKPPAPSFTPDPAWLQSLAGMYRNLLDNTTVGLKWQAGKLSAGQAGEWIAVAAGEFVGAAGPAQVHAYFDSGPPVRLRVITPDGETPYERVEPAHPTPADLAAFFGQYESSETGTTLTIAASQEPEELAIRVGSNAAVSVRPTFRDTFATPFGAVHFVRDSSGRVTALSASDARTWDLRFNRIH